MKAILQTKFCYFNKYIAKEIGINEAILLGELINEYDYWYQKSRDEDGWFYSTVENVERDVCLSIYQQQKAIEKLESLGLLETKKKGLHGVRYFLLNQEKIKEYTRYEQISRETSDEQQEKLVINNINNVIKELYHDTVYLTKDEYEKLVEKYGKKIVDNKIFSLNTYILEKGKNYKSHYATLLKRLNKDGVQDHSGFTIDNIHERIKDKDKITKDGRLLYNDIMLKGGEGLQVLVDRLNKGRYIK